MANQYLKLKNRQQEETNKFPMVFAFNNKQFEEAMEKLGFSVSKRDYVGNVASIGGGGYIRTSDSEAFHKMFDRFENELAEAIQNDETGDGFVYDMFLYELNNHEYGYTGELEPTLHALGLSFEDIRNDEKLQYGLNKARKEIMDSDDL